MEDKKIKDEELWTILARPPWRPNMQNIPYGDGNPLRRLHQVFTKQDKKA